MGMTGEDYARQLAQLLPPGQAWQVEPGKNIHGLLRGIGEALARVHTRADDLSREVDPAQTLELLDRFEAVLGLPDKCSGELETTIQGRRNAVMAKLFSTGGQSIPFFVGVGQALGFEVSITEFRAFRAGRSSAGDSLTNGDDWAYAWRIDAPEVTVIPFRAGKSAAGEPLQAWGNDTLECKMNQLKPAHTSLLIGYGANEANKFFVTADQLFFFANYSFPADLE